MSSPHQTTKRDRSATPETATPSASPSPVPKKLKPKPKSKPATTMAPRDSWTDAKRNALVNRIFVAGLQAIDTAVLAQELGVSRQQIQNQLKANRANVRRVVEGLFIGDVKEEMKGEVKKET